MHHHSYFLLELKKIERDEFRLTLSENIGCPVVPLGTHGVYDEGNMEKLSPTIPINISQTPRKIENVYIGEDGSLGEITGYTGLFK